MNPIVINNAPSEIVIITALRGEGGGGAGGTPPEAFIFTDGSLSLLGILSSAHGLGRVPVAVRVVDPDGNTIVPDNEVTANLSAIAIDLASFRPLLAGNWQLIIY